MGHQRLGTLPDTIPWRNLIAIIAGEGDVAKVAAATIEAATKGLTLAKEDAGLRFIIHQLCQFVLAAREPRLVDALQARSIPVSAAPELFDLVSAFNESIDSELLRSKNRTDLTEIGQLAALESLTRLLREKASGLYEVGVEDYRRAICELSTPNGFRNLAHEFFACFIQRFLKYHLGRELSFHVGGNGRFCDPEEHTQFLASIDIHCREVASITSKFAEDWYFKHKDLVRTTPGTTKWFVTKCLDKVRDELVIRGNRHD